MHLQYDESMKSSTIPAVRVEQDLREQLEQVLEEGESLSAFVEASVRDSVRRRVEQAEFVARGLASLANARAAKGYVSAEAAVAKLQARLDAARAKARPRRAAAK
jgi:hypothetical protein